MAITIRFLADVADWLRGLDRSEQALGDADQQLAEVMRNTIRMGREAGLTADQIADDFSEAFGVPLDRAKRAVQEVADEADDLGDKGARGIRKLGDASDDIGSNLTELGSIARDVLSGDFQGGVESALSTLGGFAAAAGVGGAVGGAVAEALSGLVAQLVQAWDPFSTKTNEVKNDVASALTEMGGAFDASAIEERLRQTASNTESWQQAVLLAKATNMDLADALAAVAGVSKGESAEAYQALQDAMNNSASSAQNLDLNALRGLEQTLQGNAQGFDDAATRSQALEGALQRQQGEAERAKEKADRYRDSLLNMPTNLPPVKLRLDTSAWDNWRPNPKTGVLMATVARNVNQVG